MIYRKIYQPGRIYQRGDTTTFGGSLLGVFERYGFEAW